MAIRPINFAACASGGHGGHIGASDLDDDGWDEILAGRGADPALAADIAAFDVDGGAVLPVPGAAFNGLPGLKYGAHAEGGDLDGDGHGEMLVSGGPDPAGSARARGFDYEGAATAMAVLDFEAFVYNYGLRAECRPLGF